MYFVDPKVEIDGKPIQQMVLIKIDEATYRQWGSPVQVPRHQIQNLLMKAIASRPTVIAIDIDLSRAADGCIHGTTERPACPDTDRQTEESLGNYLKMLNESTDKNTPLIILMGTYRQPLIEGKVNEKTLWVREPSFLDKYLLEEKRVFWSSTLLQVEEDFIRRRGHLVTLTCENEHLAAIPSMSLLVAWAHSSIKEDNIHQVAEQISLFKKELNKWAQQFSCIEVGNRLTLRELCKKEDSCIRNLPSIDLQSKPRVSAQSHTIKLIGGRIEERIIYRIVPNQKESHTDKSPLSFIETHSAQTVIDGIIDANQQIVLIGSTHQDSEDYHLIPISEKPIAGIYLVANAIDTLLRFGQLQPELLEIKLPLALLLTIISTIIFSVYSDRLMTAFFISSSIMLVILSTVSLLAMNHGVEVDIGLSMAILQIMLTLWHIFENFPSLKTHEKEGKADVAK